MRAAVLAIIFAMLVLAALSVLNDDSTNAGLPLVHASAPRQGFICTPTITPRAGPVKAKEIA